MPVDLNRLIPTADDRDVACDILHKAFERTSELGAGLQALADEHFDAAPGSSLRILQLNRAITRAALDWIDQCS